MLRVMVTGSLGYIGSVLTAYLTERGYVCTGLDTGLFEQAVIYPTAFEQEKTIKKDARDLVEADLKLLVSRQDHSVGTRDQSKEQLCVAYDADFLKDCATFERYLGLRKNDGNLLQAKLLDYSNLVCESIGELP